MIWKKRKKKKKKKKKKRKKKVRKIDGKVGLVVSRLESERICFHVEEEIGCFLLVVEVSDENHVLVRRPESESKI